MNSHAFLFYIKSYISLLVISSGTKKEKRVISFSSINFWSASSYFLCFRCSAKLFSHDQSSALLQLKQLFSLGKSCRISIISSKDDVLERACRLLLHWMNKFSGNLSHTFAKTSVLSSLKLNGNRFEGSLPLSLLNYQYLEVLDWRDCKVIQIEPYQSLPRSLIQISKMQKRWSD